MTDYQPISCAPYDQLEFAIMRAQWLNARWQDETGNEQRDRLLPLDLKNENAEEFLLARNEQGDCFRIRLDRIQWEQA